MILNYFQSLIASIKHKISSQWLALQFILLLGIISFLGDMTYEGARSITGPYLAILGATASIVGFVAGFGELTGYALRIFSGYISDKSQRYWLVMLVGYFINLLAVPMLALATSWEMAAFLIILERTGKAIRHPPRDAMLSHAASKIGSGLGFGLHQAMDQAGGLLGPLVIATIFLFKEDYQIAFASLAIPASFSIVLLLVARYMYPQPRDLESHHETHQGKNLKGTFWLYVFASGFFATGYVDFALIAFHFKLTNVVVNGWIPLFYSIAMGCNALSALIFGRLFDLLGISVMVVISLVALFFAPLVFLGGFYSCLLGMVLWGIGMGTQNTIMKAAIGMIVPKNKRSSAYGIFNSVFGVMWFLGSAVMGMLYEVSIPLLVVFSMVTQLAAVPFFFMSAKNRK